MAATPAFLPGESQGQKSLASYGPSGRKESDIAEVARHTRTYSPHRFLYN